MAIQIVHQLTLSHEELEPLTEALKSLDPDLSVAEAPKEEFQNCLEWALPAGIVIVSTGFFSELGKIGAEKLASAVARVFQRAKDKAMTWRAQGGKAHPAPPLAVEFKIENRTVRFVFPHGLAGEQVPTAFDEMNRSLVFIEKMVAWQMKQSALLRDHSDELFGPTYPTQNLWLHEDEVLGNVAFGSWVFSPSAQSWIKT